MEDDSQTQNAAIYEYRDVDDIVEDDDLHADFFAGTAAVKEWTDLVIELCRWRP